MLEVEPIGDRDVGQRADIGFDEVQTENSERPDVGTGIKRGLGPAFEQREELVERADAGPAGLDIGRHALADADAVGIGKAQGSVDVDVNVDPARREIGAREIDRLDVRREVVERADLAVLDGDVVDAVDALAGIDDMGALEHDGFGCSAHRRIPKLATPRSSRRKWGSSMPIPALSQELDSSAGMSGVRESNS